MKHNLTLITILLLTAGLLLSLDGLAAESKAPAAASAQKIIAEVPPPPADTPRDIPRRRMKATATSERGDYFAPFKAIDGDVEQVWMSEGDALKKKGPQALTLELDAVYTVDALRYFLNASSLKGRPASVSWNGRVQKYEIQVSTDGRTFNTVAAGEWDKDDLREQRVAFKPVDARFVKLVCISAGSDYAAASEIGLESPVLPGPAGDIALAKFEGEGGSYGDWKVEGTGFGTEPTDRKIATKLGFRGFTAKWLTRSSSTQDAKATGRLTSPEFVIERDYISMLIGGGHDPSKEGVKVLVEGQEVGRVCGANDRGNYLDEACIPVKQYRGRKAVVVIYDDDTNPYTGYVAVADIRQSNEKTGYERVEKKVKITGKLLLLPIAKEGVERSIVITNEGGVKLHTLFGVLAQNKEDIAWWAHLDVDDALGKTVTVAVDKKVGGSLLDLIECADEPRFLRTKYDEPQRPQFHFSQLTGWSNDPNGLTWHDGNYHLFWQCVPVGLSQSFRNMSWGHAKSPDLVHWTEMKRAIRPDAGRETPANLRHPSMAAGSCFSGSGNVDINNTAGWQKGKDKTMVLAFTDTGCGESIAYSTDKGESWTIYEGSPVIKHQGRDPKLTWYAPGQHWVMAVFDIRPPYGDNISIYTSKDLKQWEYASSIKGFYECAEIFELPDGNPATKKWGIFGADAKYAIGTFDGKKFTPDSEERGSTIYGKLYAGQCFNNSPDGRVIYITWAMTWPKPEKVIQPFNQGFSIPMQLTFKTVKGGQVHMFANAVKEIESLREAPVVNVSRLELNRGQASFSKALPGQLYDVCVTLQKKGSPKEATIALGGTTITYNFESETCAGKPAPMTGDKVNIRILIDRPTAEVFSADGYSYELMGRKDAGENVGQISVKIDAPEGSGVTVESLNVYPVKSIWPHGAGK
jgi:fructan beta-fructosidase